MKFLTNKALSFLILFFAIMAEYFHMLFIGEIHSFYDRNGIRTPIYWDDMVYYFMNESFTLIIVLILWVKLGKNNESKAIMTGISIWFFIEWVEIFLQLSKISNARLYINDGSWLQISTCLTISFLVWFTNKKLTS